jgi:glucan endo-1,3-alpha-glucosidase
LALTDDCSLKAVVTRNGKTTVDFSPPGYNFKKNPPIYNFNAFVAASPA